METGTGADKEVDRCTEKDTTKGTVEGAADATGPDTAGAGAEGTTQDTAEGTGKRGERTTLVKGPGLLLVWLYGVMSVGAVSRSAVQIATEFDRAPRAYTLSAVAALVYAFITYTLVRGGETARKVALVCCAAELAGVLVVGTWTVADPSAFADSTVWSAFGWGYLFIPVLLPVTGMLWLRGSRRD